MKNGNLLVFHLSLVRFHSVMSIDKKNPHIILCGY